LVYNPGMRRLIFSISLFLLCFGPSVSVWAEAGSLKQARAFFLQKNYVQVIDVCTRTLTQSSVSREAAAEANYLTATSYVNLFDFLTAKKNFKAIVEKCKGTAFYEDAYLGLGEVEFLQENLEEALKVYMEFEAANPSPKRRATLYFRLAELYLKKGDEANFKSYLARLESEFPNSFEVRDARRLTLDATVFTVQVGAFTNYENADKCIASLKEKGYDVYSVLCMLSGKKLCRIRVGRCPTMEEAEALKARLEKDGFFAKIFPKEGR
jgi:tetratricopeptide (TPR) repeat protein